MNSPLPLAEFLDMIKERYEDSKNPIMYKIVKILTRYDSSTFVVCDTEIAYNYNDLCVKMFDLDVSGWEISEGITDAAVSVSFNGPIYTVVTIRMTRTI